MSEENLKLQGQSKYLAERLLVWEENLTLGKHKRKYHWGTLHFQRERLAAGVQGPSKIAQKTFGSPIQAPTGTDSAWLQSALLQQATHSPTGQGHCQYNLNTTTGDADTLQLKKKGLS